MRSHGLVMLQTIKNGLFSAFAVIGLLLVLHSAWSLIMAYRSTSWPSVSGRVLDSACASGSSRTNTSARHVNYEYSVDGTTYRSAREYFGIRIASNQCTLGYTKGQPINIFFNHKNPAEAVLRPGSYRAAGFGIFVGIIFFLFAAGGYLYDKKIRES